MTNQITTPDEFAIKLNGEEVTVRHARTGHLGWQYYHVLSDDGVPVREVSVPMLLEEQPAKFKFEYKGDKIEIIKRTLTPKRVDKYTW
jgi:hypothetical protein